MKLLFDFGLVVLIWIVQLIIYPSFAYYEAENLQVWHQKYTLLITFIVLPLMLGQLILHGYAFYQNRDTFSIILLVMVVSTWVITFLWAVPLHGQIDKGINLSSVVSKLVFVNWYRTIIWTMIFVIGLFHSIKNSTLSY